MTEKTLWQWEAEFLLFINRIKQIGIKVDRDFCKPRMEKGIKICNEIAGELGWNPGSPKQIGEFLLGEMGFPVLATTPSGAPSFNKRALDEYEELLAVSGNKTAQKILRYRGWQKTASSNYKAYLELADEDGIIHPNYKVHGTRTCRTSCELPNLQQIPRSSEKEWNGDLKAAFVPRNELLALWYRSKGLQLPDLTSTVLVEFDYAQLEMRLAAAVAKEWELLEAFEADEDIFQVMADRLSWLRQDCKTFYYATSYGAGRKKIAFTFGISEDEAQGMRNDFFSAYRRLKAASDKAALIAKRQGYITYWTGRRRHLRGEGTHKAFNAYVQGGAFEIVKRSGLRLERRIACPIVLTVHDSYVLEMPREYYTGETLASVKSILEAVPEAKEMGVPFKVDYKIWGSK